MGFNYGEMGISWGCVSGGDVLWGMRLRIFELMGPNKNSARVRVS